MQKYKIVSVHFDASQKLIGVPCGKSQKYDIAGLDIFMVLESGYSDDELEEFLDNLFNLCFTKKSIEGQIDPIQEYTNTKSYSASVKRLGLVSVTWLKGRGYEVTPTWQNAKMKNAFCHIGDKAISIPTDYEKGKLSEGFRSAMEMSPIGPLNKMPE